MRRVVRRGTAEAEPEFAHSLHVECGGLEPGRDYWYRFSAGGEASPIGRTRTAPAPRRAARPAAVRLRLLRQLRARLFLRLSPPGGRAARPRAVPRRLHLRIRQPVGPAGARAQRRGRGDRPAHLPQPPRAVQDRPRPAGAARRGAVARHLGRPRGAERLRRRWSQDFDDPAAFLARRAAAYRAFWEHMPLPRSAMPRGPDATILRPLRFRRSRDVSGARRPAVPLAAGLRPGRRAAAASSWSTRPARNASTRAAAYLGMAQEAWLYQQFRSPSARWNVLAQQQLMAEFDERLDNGEIAHWSDDWNGYPAARQRLLAADRATAGSATRWCSAATSIPSGRTS